MAFFSDFSNMENFFRKRMQNSLQHTAALTGQLWSYVSQKRELNEIRSAVLAFVKTVIEADGTPLDDRELELFRHYLSGKHNPIEVERMIQELRDIGKLSPDEVIPALHPLPQEEKERLLRFVLHLAVACRTLENCSGILQKWADSFGVSPEAYQALAAEIIAERERRSKIIRSGAGILAALIIIAVFILTATLLRSVIFGLIAAYLMLPVEKYFENRLLNKKGFGYLFLTTLEKIYSPLTRLAGRISQATGKAKEISEKEKQLRFRRKIITQAITLTCMLLILFFTLLGAGISTVTGHYLRNWSQSVREWTETTPAEQFPAETAENRNSKLEQLSGKLVEQSKGYLEDLRKRFENLPAVRFVIEQLGKILKNPDTQKEIASMVLRRTGGFFSFTANVLGTIAAICADLLLTVFFFLLFLAKLAEFCQKTDNSRQSEYLVQTVFNGKWLPGVSEGTLAEARRIITGVINLLRTYIRGYLTLVVVDSTVYSTCFFLIGVPYSIVLGVIAGCGILLPYLGPILSTTLTVLVMLATGCSGGQLIAVLIAYLIYNGIIEQFILYPAVIGESLGLTALETIIVVLLGAIFAGIPGMLLALPAAAVLKFLVPQIYNCFGSNAETSH